VKWISFSWIEVGFSVWSRVANPIGYARSVSRFFKIFSGNSYPNHESTRMSTNDEEMKPANTGESFSICLVLCDPRKCDGVSFALSPLRFRRLAGPPHLQSWIDHQQSPLPGLMSVQAQGALVTVPKGDLDIPAADHVRSPRRHGLVPWRVWRLCLGHGNTACLDDQDEN
jgi:hypothetical protein